MRTPSDVTGGVFVCAVGARFVGVFGRLEARAAGAVSVRCLASFGVRVVCEYERRSSLGV
jgi:hypothetical protein